MDRKTNKNRTASDASKRAEKAGTATAHRTPSEREELIHNPNYNQAGNEAGSSDQTQGSQTGNDIDTVP